MYIYDYYIIIYDKLFEHEKYYEEFISKKDKQIIAENNINPKIDQSFNNQNNDIKIMTGTWNSIPPGIEQTWTMTKQ